jgi:D-alanyl-D-alanine carboxypeptidase/D-alanyl-D-alanine-endopeptidase (penicillin-binding protein 4)
MKRLLPPVLAVLLLGFPASPAYATAIGAPPRLPAPPDPERARVARLQQVLGAMLRNGTLGRVRVGAQVISARTGRVFFEHAGRTLMDPASNQKVLATATALMRLGSDWRFRTEVGGPAPDGDGVIAGSLYLRGSGDPTLRAQDLQRLASRLVARGVTRVDGGVIGDPRRIGVEGSGGAERERRPVLIVGRGITVIRVRPGEAPGAPPLVLTDPVTAGDRSSLSVVNTARTVAGGRPRITVRLALSGGRMQVAVAGQIPAGSSGLAFRRRVPYPALQAAMMLRSALVAAGIAVRDPAGTGASPPARAPGFVEVHRSAPLGVVLRRINKDSDNDQSERLLEAVGAEVRGGAGTTAKGLSVLREVIGGLGLAPGSYLPRNASGLGHANRITPEAMAGLLRALYLDPRVGPEILQSLSVGGVDGTTRNRYKGSLAARRGRAKTGTLDSKSCLSGLVGDGNDLVVFSLMVQGFRGRRLGAVRAAQVGAVNAIMRYVREGAGERIDLPSGFDEAAVGTDYETGEEFLESEGEMAESLPGAAESPAPAPRPGEDAVDALLRQARERGAGGAGGRGGKVPSPIRPSSYSPPSPPR